MVEMEVTRVEVVENQVFVRGINRDGSLMDEEFIVDKGFERIIEKFEAPGIMERISDDRLADIEQEKKNILRM